MSYRDRGQKQSAFWDSLRENARSITEDRHAALKKNTCDPSYCLLLEDKEMMRNNLKTLKRYDGNLDRLKEDNCGSRRLAFTTVLLHKPLLLLK